MRKNAHRLVPLEVLYPSHASKDTTKERSADTSIKTTKNKVIPFYKPGIAAKLPEKTQENTAVRFLQASTIKCNLMSLEQSLKDIEDDSSFIANSMNEALLVPQAIERTFHRIHGRIYDIHREIEYSANTQDDKAIVIQNNYRMASNKAHLAVIMKALHNTMCRDCASIHESLLGFLLSYAKADDHFKMLLNRRFLVRNRNALKYWREWSIQTRELEKKQKEQIVVLQKNWMNRICTDLIKKWKILSFSKHSRKALTELHSKIATEAQKRLANRQAMVGSNQSNQSILELLAIEREKVIIDFGRKNYNTHMETIVFKYWRIYVEECRKESRSGNAIAREYYINRMKRSFFNAWYSLSVGRVVIFGGYTIWRRPVNHNLVNYRSNFTIELDVIREWRWLCIRRHRMVEFSNRVQKEFLRKCLKEFHRTAQEHHESLSKLFETYIVHLHQRMHKVFSAWHLYTAKEKVRRQPILFMTRRAQLMRKYRELNRCFRRWSVRFLTRQHARFIEEAKTVEGYTKVWKEAGIEMKGSMELISQLGTKLASELSKRKEDLNVSIDTSSFMRNEQRSLAHAMKNVQFEIEKLHTTIKKSSMRYFVDLKTIHSHVVDDVPAALRQYNEQKELERQRYNAQKLQNAQIQISTNSKPQPKSTTNNKNRRKTTFTNNHSKARISVNSRSSLRSRKSVNTADSGVFGHEGEEEEEEE